jgi:hypothetical protein
MILLAVIAAAALPIAAQESTNSTPPDLTPYFRAKVPQDYAPQGRPALPLPLPPSVPIFPNVFVVDTVINNSDPNLTNTDHFGDTEPSIAINPVSCIEGTAVLTLHGCQQIVILAFSGAWGGAGTFAPLWYTTNGGTQWTKEQTIPVPPNVAASGCPCDQDPDWGPNNQLSATFLTVPTNVYTGTTTNPADSTAWNWFTSGGVAQRTNQFGVGAADQPWMLVNRDPDNPAQTNVYVDYDDFNGAPDMHVAVSYGLDPPEFTVDNIDGFSTGGINPGHRLAKDPRNGTMYSLYQRCVANCGGDPKTINYTLNRSLDGGMTWGLNGSPNGITAATGQSTQPTPKFGTVNALLGGVQHVSVDPISGDVYVVYGNRDAMTGNNRMSIVRLTDDGMGGLTIGPSFFVTGQVQAALPSVAVARDARASVGVLYDTFDGFDPQTGLPTFSAHLAVSQNHGQTFQDVILETFLSPVLDNHNSRQRILGDYHQLKSYGLGFYGVFTANGVPFGRPFADTDPIFFKTFVGP